MIYSAAAIITAIHFLFKSLVITLRHKYFNKYDERNVIKNLCTMANNPGYNADV